MLTTLATQINSVKSVEIACFKNPINGVIYKRRFYINGTEVEPFRSISDASAICDAIYKGFKAEIRNAIIKEIHAFGTPHNFYATFKAIFSEFPPQIYQENTSIGELTNGYGFNGTFKPECFYGHLTPRSKVYLKPTHNLTKNETCELKKLHHAINKCAQSYAQFDKDGLGELRIALYKLFASFGFNALPETHENVPIVAHGMKEKVLITVTFTLPETVMITDENGIEHPHEVGISNAKVTTQLFNN